MSRLKVLSSELTELAVIDDALSASRTEIINSDNTLSFSVLLTKQNTALFNATNIIELDSDYFDIARYRKGQSEDGRLTCEVDCEHVSYRLNNATYDKEYFTETGTPAAVLSTILNGTGFYVGTIEFTTPITYSAQEKKSRRGLLVQFAEYLGGELVFSGFTVSIVRRRGSTTPRSLIAEGCISVISKTLDKTTLDDKGNPTVSYECTAFNPSPLSLGDTVLLDYETLDIDVTLRIVSLTTNPYNKYDVSFSVSNTVPAVEDAAYEIATTTVAKDALYNGCRIGPEYGFEAVRNDRKARAFFKSDGMKFQTGDGTGNTWADKLYYAVDTDSGNTELFFNGKLTADVIEALSAVIAPNLYAGKATIAEVTVDELDTSDKVKNYLNGDTSANNYQKIYDQFHEFITGVTDGLDKNKVQAEDRTGAPLYWTDDTHTTATTTVTAYPVYTYKYTDTAKLKLGFGDDPSGTGYQIPMIELGAGTGTDSNAKGFIYKGLSGLYLDYYSTSGELRRILLSDDGIVLTPYALKSLDMYLNGFSAAYDADTVAMTWALDSGGRIVSLTTPDNVTIPVTWHSEEM